MKNLVFAAALFLVLGKANAQSFEANKVQLSFDTVDGEKRIVWETKKEVNTSYFILYKSVDGNSFEQIARVQAKGSCGHASQYIFTDEEANGKASYKVVLVNMEGLTTSSAPVKFFDINNDNHSMNNIAKK